ncbi:MAG: hypothetical protein F4X09_11880 [Gammaproteobacteria bacterium]|nr:hypothetical protein [Gammaproteobacteria bacterium]
MTITTRSLALGDDSPSTIFWDVYRASPEQAPECVNTFTDKESAVDFAKSEQAKTGDEHIVEQRP